MDSKTTRFAIGKAPIAAYIGSGCKRRLWLDSVVSDAERLRVGAVRKDRRVMGADFIKEQGHRHETERYKELIAALGDDVIRGPVERLEQGYDSFASTPLGAALARMVPGQAVVEAEFTPDTRFLRALGLESLPAAPRISTCRPDVVHMLEPRSNQSLVSPDGEIRRRDLRDRRPALVCFDVKLAMEPGPKHFAEIAYYSMALASWLESEGLSDRFAVLSWGGIWPGPSGSLARKVQSLRERSRNVVLQAWYDDMNPLPLDAVLGRMRRAFAKDMIDVLTVEEWSSLPIHVDARCAGCDYLGYEFFPKKPGDGSDELPAAESDDKSEKYCLPAAKAQDHLSRIPGMTEAASGILKEAGILTVADLSRTPPDHEAFERHQVLGIERHAFRARALALSENRSIGVHEDAGTTMLLPRFSDIRISISVEFDAASGRCFAFGYQMVAAIPRSKTEVEEHRGDVERVVDPSTKPSRVLLVRRPEDEAMVLTRFLNEIRAKLQTLRDMVEDGYRRHGGDKHAGRKATVQFYVWDTRSLDKLKEKVGEHILTAGREPAVDEASSLAWLFPPEHMITDLASPSEAVTVVKPALRLVALALPHAYGQLEVANLFRHMGKSGNREPETFGVHYHFGDPLSDAIPSARGHELWGRRSPKKGESVEDFEHRLEKAVQMRSWATLSVARKLAHELKGRLSRRARTVESLLTQPTRVFGGADDMQVVYQHALLNDSAAAAEIETIMSTPPEEREARFVSVRLDQRIEGAERARILAGMEIEDRPLVWAFRMSERSKDAKIKKGDFAFSLMPENQLDMAGTRLEVIRDKYEVVMPPTDGESKEDERKRLFREKTTSLREALATTVLGLDRAERIIVLEVKEILALLEQIRVFDMNLDPSNKAILDPLHTDMFTSMRLRPALEALGTPEIAIRAPLISSRISRIPPERQEITPVESPSASFIWRADEMARTRSGRSLEAAGEGRGLWLAGEQPLNSAQAEGFESAIENRLTLLLGPPGTGKSATATAIVAGLIHEAKTNGKRLRLALTGPTWVAIDNVLKKMPKVRKKLGLGEAVRIVRLRSASALIEDIEEDVREFAMVPSSSHADAIVATELTEQLMEGAGIVVVGGTASQLAALGKLHSAAKNTPPRFFDYMIVDEASQMDVAHALVAYGTLADDASLLVVGDDKQMAPIHPVPPPKGSEFVVGSIYDFYDRYRRKEGHKDNPHAIPRRALSINYRSNSDIVGVSALVGYPGFASGVPDIRLPLDDIPTGRPDDMPSELPWHESIPDILSPGNPLVALVHQDTLSSQRNVAEARWVASMVAALRGRIRHLHGEKAGELMDDVDLFKHGVGVVTPHRAQQAAVVEALQHLGFDKEATNALYASVDTVERFQGQERLVMLASFGMGDSDQIAGEAEFLFSLNRFNVIISRAQTKMIVMMSRSMADHLPKDYAVLRGAKLVHRYIDGRLLEHEQDIVMEGLGRVEWLQRRGGLVPVDGFADADPQD